jgi:hypothetical protein
MDAQLFIQKVAAGEAGEAKDTLTDMLSSKAFEALDARKQEIARTIYGEDLDVEVQDTADSEIEEDELLTQEEFIALSDEDQELYLEALEQLDEIGDTPAGRQALGKYVKKRVKQLPKIEVGYQMAPSDRDARMVKKYQSKVNKGIGRAVDRLAKEEFEELDEISQKTAVKAYSARLGREDDDTGPTKSMKTMDRIHKKYGAKGVMRAATAADKEHGIHSADYTKKDFVGDYLSSKK